MSEWLLELARRIQNEEWNRSGSDKTWVLETMWEYLRFQAELRQSAHGHDA